MSGDSSRSAYFPPPESGGGWRLAKEQDDSLRLAGIDVGALGPARAWNAAFGITSSVAVVRKGYLVAEWYEGGAQPDTRFNIYSCSKSFTGTAYGLLFDDVRNGVHRDTAAVDLDTPAYSHIPEGRPLSDPRKEAITLRHLLSMSSGIRGEASGIGGLPVDPDVNQFAAAVGHRPFRSERTGEELWADKLAADPGTLWDYSDPAFAHLSLAHYHITGRELDEVIGERVLAAIGTEAATWDRIGMDDGRYGRHTLANSGVHVSARELARFGYLMVRGGAWAGKQIIAPWWTEIAAQSSQPMNPGYGLTWWVNTGGALWDGVPHDAFSAMGFNCNLCCVIPSLDLVVVRIGAGPTDSTEVIAGPFLAAVASAVVDAGP
ncbi:MAG: beta-lactamase family protein [Chloroflexi bacterium]|nr:beta-lactamase family protein [Chloroflexota bacterium]